MADQVLNDATVTSGARPAPYEEYLALPHQGRLIEWVNGEVIYHMPPTLPHQYLADFLTTLLKLFVDFFALGRVISAPAEMKCGPDGPSREPDVLFLANANLSRTTGEKRIEGPADLVVEIVSDDSVSRDFDDKFIEYQECGVLEYWIVDPRPRRKRALFYQRSEEGILESVLPEAGHIYRSNAMPGFWLKVDWLWDMPDVQLTFAEIAGFSQATLAELREAKRQRPG